MNVLSKNCRLIKYTWRNKKCIFDTAIVTLWEISCYWNKISELSVRVPVLQAECSMTTARNRVPRVLVSKAVHVSRWSITCHRESFWGNKKSFPSQGLRRICIDLRIVEEKSALRCIGADGQSSRRINRRR